MFAWIILDHGWNNRSHLDQDHGWAKIIRCVCSRVGVGGWKGVGCVCVHSIVQLFISRYIYSPLHQSSAKLVLYGLLPQIRFSNSSFESKHQNYQQLVIFNLLRGYCTSYPQISMFCALKIINIFMKNNRCI